MFKNYDDMPAVLTIPEAAEVLRISTNHLYYMLSRDKTIPVVKFGRRRLIPKDKLMEWMENHCQSK